MKNKIFIPVSLGEIADKLSVLEVKSKEIKDLIALENVLKEKVALELECKKNNIEFGEHLNELVEINHQLWNTLQNQRDKESNGELDEEFVQISLSVYHINDKRFEVKQKINNLFGSDLVEEKFYK